MLPAASTAGPHPLCHTPPSRPFDVVLKTNVCRREVASYPSTQPWYGGTSPCEANPTMTLPLERSRAGRWFCVKGLKGTLPCPSLPSPEPATLALITTGPPNFSAPVVMSSACSRCTYWGLSLVAASLVLATTYSVPPATSTTGVPVIPISGVRSVEWTSSLETEMTFGGCRKLTCHSGD